MSADVYQVCVKAFRQVTGRDKPGGEWEVVIMVPRCSLCSSSHDFPLLIKGLTPKLLECVLISL